MKIAYKHLINFLVDKPSIKDVSEKLFQLGHEHEIEESIFNMEFTPNRGDCLSLLGLARELNVFYKTNLDLNIYNPTIKSLDLNFTNNVVKNCPSIFFLNIEIEDKVTKYNDYLEEYFTDLKLNKNNFFTDVSNFIAYEMGQPTHCYDFDLFTDNSIVLTNKIIENKFKTLFDKDIELDGTDMVFTNHNKVINLAGIVGGMETSCSKKTQNALVECAYFLPESIIGRAIKYNVQSDASHKFERGVDPQFQEKVLRRFIQIVSEHSKISKVELYSNSSKEFNHKELDIDLIKINKILGTNESSDTYKNALIKLGFKVDNTIRVPSFRSDITNQNDLAEEFGRVIGYDNISTQDINLPNMLDKKVNLVEENIKSFLVHKGFFEVINYPFCNDNFEDSIKVDNPLDSNRNYLRTSIMDSLVSNVIYNEKRQKDSIKIFEISDVYSSSNIIVDKRLAIAISGRQGHNFKEFNKILDKKYLSSLFKELNLDIEKDIINIPKEKLDSKSKAKIFAIEISIKDLKNDFNRHFNPCKKRGEYIQYEPISEFPTTSRDLSFSIEDSSVVNQLINILDSIDANYLKESFMFDYYKNTETNITKVGYRFIFQSHSKTLTDLEIDKIVSDIVDPILLIDSVSIPGLKNKLNQK
ncbi:phenylalanine--tRNA ligase subunit beta [Gammaproteobacteria bacterium]|nr:phenylalanine--tRNA ligase subunit beta [Gammaproteobacteria bacterium]